MNAYAWLGGVAAGARAGWSQRRVAAKTMRAGLLAAMACGQMLRAEPSGPDLANVSAALTPEGGRITVQATTTPTPVPLFFTANVNQLIRISAEAITGEAAVTVHVLQGRPEVLSFGLVGAGEVTNVTGDGIRDWSVRQGLGATAGRHYLDVRPVLLTGKETPRDFSLTITFRLSHAEVPDDIDLPLLTSGAAAAFRWHGRIEPSAAVDLRIMHLGGVTPVNQLDGESRVLEFINRGDPVVTVHVARRGSAAPDADFTQFGVTGQVDEAANSVLFHCAGQVKVSRSNVRVPVLSGHAALSTQASGDGWHIELASDGPENGYVLVFDRAGMVPVAFDFAAEIRQQQDWRGVDFRLAGGPVVPVTLTGFTGGVQFDPGASVVLTEEPKAWRGYLPADGAATLRWKATRENAEAALVFASSEQTEIRVATGLLRQVSEIHLHVMQGKLQSVRLRVDGPGEIVGVDGTNIVGWQLVPAEKSRVIDVRFSRPIESDGVVSVRAQSVLGDFPVRAKAIQFTPEGAVRHSGYIRVANAGAVRIDVTDARGVLQLAPTQFPGAALEASARQVFVYRFPSAARSFVLQASRIVPEVGVSQVTMYALGQTDRTIESDIELEIREAPLRNWAIAVPADYAVVEVRGADVSDYAVESAGASETRLLKLLFARQVTGRELVHVRLEKNEPAKAGDWKLVPLRFPAAKSVRGHIGIRTTAGFRIVPNAVEHLTEVPLSLFPNQVRGLQQAFRVRDENWSASMRVAALGQSIQADVFHLYSLKQGGISASILLNYFVVGAPASELRVEVPSDAGNVDVMGQGVRRDWRREGNVIVVALHEPVLGALTMLVTFEQPLSARGGAIRPGEARPLDVQSERGYVEVASSLQVQLQVAKATGSLLKLEPLELPPELRLLTTTPSLATYQYTARPFALELGVTWYQPAETVDQVIDFAQYSSQIARDGQVVTTGRIFVKTRGRKVLRFQLPADVKLWESRVDGELVTARADGEWIVVPLAARLNPNDPVSVDLQFGQPAASARSVQLSAPRMTMPMVVGEWTLHSDRERLLVPRGGTAELTAPNLTETGFEWLALHDRGSTIALLLLVALTALVARLRSGVGVAYTVVSGACAVGLALVLLNESFAVRRTNQLDLVYAATVVPANSPVSLQLGNLPPWQAMISWWGIAAIVAGMALGVAAWRQRRTSRRAFTSLTVLAVITTFGGVLAQRFGAPLFFLVTAALIVTAGLVPALRDAWALWRVWRGRGSGPAAAGAPSTVVPLLLIGFIGAGLTLAKPEARAQTELIPATTAAAEGIVQHWDVRDHRLFGDVDITVRATPGDTFVLLKTPAVLTGFSGDGLRVTKIERGDHAIYCLACDRAGLLTGHAKFELAVGELTQGLPVLTGPAAVQRITVQLDQPGWEFSSPNAVEVRADSAAGADRCRATIVLRPGPEAVVNLTPQHRDAGAEPTRFFAEVANLYVPGPGVVNGYARVTVRPVQGRLSQISLGVPDGFSVADVSHGPVGNWRFDPTNRQLHVTIEPAQTDVFKIAIELQRSGGALPFELALQPLRVVDAVGQFGSLGVAFSGDAQPEQLRPSGLSSMNVDDFDAELLPRGRDNRTLATVQAAYRYSEDTAGLRLRVAAVEPEIRVTSRQLLSLGDDRVVLAADLNVSITRAGVFQLSFALPPGLDVEAVSGSALSHWTDAVEHGAHVVTLHLNGRTLGEQTFAVTLAGAAPTASQPWVVPQLILREATRQTGDLQVVPERGLRLRTLERSNVSELDPRSLGDTRPGALAFRLLDQSASLTLGIEALDPWVTVQALEEVTLREGQTLTRLAMHYHVENAGVKRLHVRLPGLTEEQAKSLHATGAVVADLVPAGGGPEHWEIRLQRSVIGDTDVQLEFQGAAGRGYGHEPVVAPRFEGVRQVDQFVAIRGGGRLEVDAPTLPRGWQRVDWTAVPVALQDRADRSVPALTLQVAEADTPLDVVVTRHGVADVLKLRVTKADLTTVVSPRGGTLTAVELQIAVAEKSPLRLGLPRGAVLFNTFMNGESVTVVRDGDTYLFHVMPSTAEESSAHVRLVYSVNTNDGGEIETLGPRLNVPLENVAWRVVIPPGYELAGYHGGLRLVEERSGGFFGVSDYQASVASRRAADARQATDFLQTASTLLEQGRQQQAGELLMRAAKTSSLDEASNEDARVQLRALRTQQTVVGLNTRRQRLYLNNKLEAFRNEQLEAAANLNPVMRGKLDFNPQQIDQLLMGNTVEENTALRGIAAHIVDQQLAAEPTTSAIDVTIPERGRVLTFGRTLQVNGEAPLALQLSIERESRTRPLFGLALLAALGVIVGVWLPSALTKAAPTKLV